MDAPGNGPDGHSVSDNKQIVDNDEEAGYDIFDELLGAKSDCKPDNACGSNKGHDVEADGLQQSDAKYEEQHVGDDALAQALHCAQTPSPLLAQSELFLLSDQPPQYAVD